MKHKKIMSIVMASAMLVTSVPSSISSVFAKDVDSNIQVTSETSSEDDIKVDSSSNDINVTNGDSDIKVTPKESTDYITVNDKVDDTGKTSESTEATDKADTEATDDLTIESSFIASVENKDAKDKLSVGDTAKLHVKAENKSADTANLKLYFSDTDTQLTADKMQWSGYLTNPAMSMSIKDLNKECMLIVPVKTQDEKTMDSALKFLKEVKDDIVLSRYAVVELPAGASTEFDITIANTNASIVSVIPVMEQKATLFGDAATLTWKNDDGITILDKIAGAITKDDTSNSDDIQISDVQGAEKTVDDVDKSDFASKRLVVVSDEKSVFTDADKVIGQYDNIYLLQYETVKDAKGAYARFKDVVTAVEPDKDVSAATNDATTVSESTEASIEESTEEFTEEFTEESTETNTDTSNAISALNDMDASTSVQKEKGVIALIDTGVSESDNVIDRVSVIDDVLTGNGHGDKMLADILSQDEDAKILSIRAMNDNGFGTISSLVAAMEYAIDQKVDYINLSLYARTTLTTSVLEQEIIKATKAGIVVIGAAGNDGADVKDYVPGSVMEAYIIGAAKEDGTRQTLSNFGDTVDYNVVADSTSDATALFTGYVSKNGLDAVADVLNKGFVYATSYKKDETDFNPIAEDVDFSKYTIDKSKSFIVRYSFVDSSKINENTTFDSIFDGEENMDAIYSVFIDQPDVYAVGDGTYKIKANAPILNGSAKHDYVLADFARGNDYGEIVTDGVSIDLHTGIITATEDAFKSSGKDYGDEEFANLQAQIMIPSDSVPDKAVQTVTVQDKSGKVSYDVKSAVYGMQQESIPLSIVGSDKALTSDDFDVYLNGATHTTKVTWNDDTRTLYADGIYAASVYSVKVVVKKKFDSAFRVAVDDIFASPNCTYRDVGAMFQLPDGVDLTKLSVGTKTTAMSFFWNNGYAQMGPQLPANEIMGTVAPYSKKAADPNRVDHGGVDGDFTTATNLIGIPRTLFGVDFRCMNVTTGADMGTLSGDATYTPYNHGIWSYCHHITSSKMDHQKHEKDVFYKILDSWENITNGYTYFAMVMMSDQHVTGGNSPQSGGGVIVFRARAKQKGGFTIQKAYNNATLVNGNSNYSLAGAVYKIYSDAGCTTEVGSLTTDANGKAATGDESYDAGTYYIKEVTASPGCTLDTTTHSVTVVAGEGASKHVVNSTEPVITGSITVTKQSTLPNITDNNKCYSFEGAQYSVYKTNNNGALSDSVGTITIGANGSGKLGGLAMRTYYVKETKAPTNKSYGLDSTIYTVTVSNASGQTLNPTVTSKEKPENDPAYFEMTKKWDGEKTATVPSLWGTQFTIEYYDGYYDKNNLPSSATRTWVVGLQYNDAIDAYYAALDDKWIVPVSSDGTVSSPLYRGSASETVLPLGTYVCWESQAAPGYTLEGDLYMDGDNTVYHPADRLFQQVKKKGDSVIISGNNVHKAENTPKANDIKIVKYKQDGKTPLAGVVYELKDHHGNVVGKQTTDSKGVVHFKDLYPDVYTVTEVSAPNGYTLLKEPITVNCPMRVTDDDITKLGIDRKNVIFDPVNPDDSDDDIYYVLSQTFNVSNDWNFAMPRSGAMITAKRFIPIACGMVVLMGATCVVFFKKKKKRI